MSVGVPLPPGQKSKYELSRPGVSGSVSGSSSGSNFDTGSGSVGYASSNVSKIVEGSANSGGSVVYEQGSSSKGGVPVTPNSNPTVQQQPQPVGSVPVSQGVAEKIAGKSLSSDSTYSVIPASRPTSQVFTPSSTDFSPGLFTAPGQVGYQETGGSALIDINVLNRNSASVNVNEESFKSFGRGGVLGVGGGLVFAGLAFGIGASEGLMSIPNFVSPVNLFSGRAQVPVVGPAIDFVKSVPGIPVYVSKNPFEFAGMVAGGLLGGKIIGGIISRPGVSVTDVKAVSEISVVEGGVLESTSVSSRMISKPFIGKSQEFSIEGLSSSKVLISDSSYVRYGMFGNQVFKGDGVVSNVRGTIGGSGTFDVGGGFVERSAVVIEQQGKGSGVLGVSTIGNPVEGFGTRLLSGTADFSESSKSFSPRSVTFGVSKESFSVGDTTVYNYQGSSLGGSRMLNAIDVGYGSFKSDFVSKPGKMPVISGGGDVGVLVETGKVTVNNLVVSKQGSQFSGVGLSSVDFVKGNPSSLVVSQVQSGDSKVKEVGVVSPVVVSSPVVKSSPLVDTSQFSVQRSAVVPVVKSYSVSSVGSMSVVKPDVVGVVSPVVVSSPVVKSTPLVDTGQIQSQRPIIASSFSFSNPNVPVVPSIPPFSFNNNDGGNGFGRNLLKVFGGKRLTRYTPSFSALAFGISGGKKGSGGFSGLGFRGIPKGYSLVSGKGLKISSMGAL